MRKSMLTTLALATTLMACGTPTGHAPVATTLSRAMPAAEAAPTRELMQIADVAERVVPAVVSIQSTRTVQQTMGPFGLPFGTQQPQEATGTGSGVIIDASGTILTNHHVVEDASKVQVQLHDGRIFEAEVVGSDKPTDVAVIRIQGRVPGDLTTLPLADSDAVRLGEVVLAIGSPFGLDHSITMGIVSATGRTDLQLASYEDFIQTDAAINPGNSGGALVNMKGELVGINTAIFSRSGGNNGLGFAIPSNLATEIGDRLLKDGKVNRSYLGVLIQDVDRTLASAFGIPDGTEGVLVSQVLPDGAAKAAGIEEGDLIVAIDHEPIASGAQLRNKVALMPAGKPVDVRIIRDGKPRTIRVALRSDAEEVAKSSQPRTGGGELWGGVSLMGLDEARRRGAPLPGSLDTGVVIADLDRGSAAARAGLIPGDILLEVNREPVRTADEVRRLSAGKGTVLLLVQRGQGRQWIALERP